MREEFEQTYSAEEIKYLNRVLKCEIKGIVRENKGWQAVSCGKNWKSYAIANRQKVNKSERFLKVRPVGTTFLSKIFKPTPDAWPTIPKIIILI